MDTDQGLYRPPAPYPSKSEMASKPISLETNTLRYLPEELYNVDVYDFEHATPPKLLINDPELVKFVLEDRSELFCKANGLIELLKPLLGDHPVVTSDNSGHDLRLMIKSVFTHQSQTALFNHVTDSLAHFDEFCSQTANEKQEIDLAHLFTRISFDIAFRNLFSRPVPDKIYERLSTHLSDFDQKISELVRKTANQGAAWQTPELPEPIIEAGERVRKVVADHIEISLHNKHYSHLDMFYRLLVARSPETNRPFSQGQLVDQVTALINSQQISGAIMTWVFYVVSQCPETLKRIRQEVCKVAGNSPISSQDLPRLRFTRDVLREVLRLYPPVPHLTRRALRDITHRKLKIAKDTHIFISPWIIHRHNKYWTNPDRFDPDRFARGDIKGTLRNFLPFGRGPRMCTGASSAVTQGTLTLAHLASRYDFEMLCSPSIEPDGVLFLEPTEPMLCRISPVSASACKI